MQIQTYGIALTIGRSASAIHFHILFILINRIGQNYDRPLGRWKNCF